MSYLSVDHLQKLLTEQVFHYADDKKKAAGRALGTLVEMVTFYLLKSWGLESAVAIERGLSEYKNPAISHNVEYSLHPVVGSTAITVAGGSLPITSAKLFANIRQNHPGLHAFDVKAQTVLGKDGVLRNACVVGQADRSVLVALVHATGLGLWELKLVEQLRPPYAMFECKRVGGRGGPAQRASNHREGQTRGVCRADGFHPSRKSGRPRENCSV